MRRAIELLWSSRNCTQYSYRLRINEVEILKLSEASTKWWGEHWNVRVDEIKAKHINKYISKHWINHRSINQHNVVNFPCNFKFYDFTLRDKIWSVEAIGSARLSDEQWDRFPICYILSSGSSHHCWPLWVVQSFNVFPEKWFPLELNLLNHISDFNCNTSELYHLENSLCLLVQLKWMKFN